MIIWSYKNRFHIFYITYYSSKLFDNRILLWKTRFRSGRSIFRTITKTLRRGKQRSTLRNVLAGSYLESERNSQIITNWNKLCSAHQNSSSTQSKPFLRWIPMKLPRGNVSLINLVANSLILGLQRKYLCKSLFSNCTGKLAGAPVKAKTVNFENRSNTKDENRETRIFMRSTRPFFRRIFLLPLFRHIAVMYVVV